MRAYDTISGARQRMGRYMNFYNTQRTHRAYGGSSLDSAYFTSLAVMQQAA